MKWVAVLCLALGACSAPCEKGPNVLVTLKGDDALFAQATSLTLVVDGQQTKAGDPPISVGQPLKSGTTLLLEPTVTPSGSEYDLTVFATLSSDSTTLGSGVLSVVAGTHACNHATLEITGKADGGTHTDLNASFDLPLADLSIVDLARPDLECVPDGYDEDGDGLSDPCDVCAANSNNPPTDTDGDGVPDACDPRPAANVNAVLLFEPFNAPLSGWTGQTTESGGSLVVTDMGCTSGGVHSAGVGPEVQLQTYVTPTALDLASAPDYDGVGIYAVDNGSSTSGVACILQTTSMGQTQLVAAYGAVLGDPNFGGGGTRTTAGLQGGDVAVGVTVRLRLSVRNSLLTCEAATPAGMVLATRSVAPGTSYTNLEPILGTCYAAAKFSSLFAVSDP